MKQGQGVVAHGGVGELEEGIYLASQQKRFAELAGKNIRNIHAQARGNGAPTGGFKVVKKSGWFVMRPFGTENIYKFFAEFPRC